MLSTWLSTLVLWAKNVLFFPPAIEIWQPFGGSRHCENLQLLRLSDYFALSAGLHGFRAGSFGAVERNVDRCDLFCLLLVSRRALPGGCPAYGNRASRAGLQGMVHQDRHGGEQRVRNLCGPDCVGKSASVASQEFRPRWRSEQTRRRRLLAHLVSLHDAV